MGVNPDSILFSFSEPDQKLALLLGLGVVFYPQQKKHFWDENVLVPK